MRFDSSLIWEHPSDSFGTMNWSSKPRRSYARGCPKTSVSPLIANRCSLAQLCTMSERSYAPTKSRKLWKGKREQDLEARVMNVLAESTRREPWQVFDLLDAICEQIASDGSSRLARSVI